MLFQRFRYQFSSKKTVSEVFEKHFSGQPKSEETHSLGELHFLSDLVQIFRPLNVRQVETVSIRPLIDYLAEHPRHRLRFIGHLDLIISKRDFRSVLTESGILQRKPFFRELRKRIFAKLVPYQPERDTIEYLLAQIFLFTSDIVWVRKIPREELDELCLLLELPTIYQPFREGQTLHEIFKALSLIAQRIGGHALESEVIQMVPELIDLDSPFEQLALQLEIIEKRFVHENLRCLKPDDIDLLQLYAFHQQCVSFIDMAYRNSRKFGISMTVNQSLLRIRQQLQRFRVLTDFLVLEQEEKALDQSISFGIRLIKFHCHKNNIKRLFNDSTQIIAYEVTQHTAKTGEHYITSGKKEYLHMLYTAMGGGLIVGFMCITKLLLGNVHISDFGHAFLYSMNYALGFIAIYLLGYTLATKQPAMTAATLIQSIEKGMNSKEPDGMKHRAFAELFARLFRSQFIAFVGNVIIAFPTALLLIFTIDQLFDINIAASKHVKLLHNISPVHSPAIFHSAIAGVFLFLSGVISGSIANRNKHINLYYRIQEHPALKIILGAKSARKTAEWFEHKWPGVASNFWFGVFMGSVASVGVFIGLNLDIRHITFASGNLALSLYGGDFEITTGMLFLGIFGIGLIGLINFAVSFLLSLSLALRSRNIPWKELIYLFGSVWRYFRQHPTSFFFPVKK